MTDPLLLTALARGTLVVTPNKRLAREIGAQHDRVQLGAGRLTWPAARVMPWNTWVAELTEGAQDAGLGLPRQRLDDAQAAQLWQSIVGRDLASAPLVDAGAAASLAAEAWERVHGYGAGGESWRGFADEGPDPAAFARWAESFVRATARLDTTDAARAADAIAQVASELPAVPAMDVALAGFIEYSPQQQRLLDALERCGARVTHFAPPHFGGLGSAARLAKTTTARDELTRALDWARRKAERDPALQVGIVVLDLAERSALVRTLAEDRLCAALQWPGRAGEARPYEISLSAPLSSFALVATALDLVMLAQRPLDRGRAATLLRSRYLPGAPNAWMARGVLEREWLQRGVGKVSLARVIEALDKVDARLAQRWRNARDHCRIPSRATPRQWAESWRAWLDAVGWLEGHTLDSAEYQALGAWNKLVAGFARLAAVAPDLTRDEAMAALVRLAHERSFQPESPGARIRILGLLEATGLSFDALWVAGFAADAWPQKSSPNPLLPIGWQRERGVPRSHPSRELEFARRMTEMLSSAAPEVVFSYASQADDHERAASPLVASLAPLEDSGTGSPALSAERMFATRPTLDRLADYRAPPLPPGSRLPGGARMIEAQSDCPFRAATLFRLCAENWPSAAYGLTASERGTLVHATLAALWRELGDHATLAALSGEALDQRIAAALAKGRAALERSRWEALPAVIAQVESACVSTQVREWLQEVDRARPAFSVAETELGLTVAVGGYTMKLQLDRVDALAEGGSAIIDYKTGKVGAPAKWFDPRPDAPQLALYAFGLARNPGSDPVRALVYAQVRRGEMKAIGIGEDAALWPGLKLPSDLKREVAPDWSSALRHLESTAEALAGNFGAGDAGVLPRNAGVCKRCKLHAVCRIGAPGTADDDGADSGTENPDV